MNEFLNKGINTKIISVLFAVLLWFFVLDSSANPFDTRTFTIPLKVLNEASLQEKSLGVKNRDFSTNVNISVKGRRDKISSLSSYDFEALIDFARIKESGMKELGIDVRTSKEGISIDTKKPQVINVEVDKIIKNTFDVEIVPKGKLKENYKIIKSTATPESIEIEGIESLVKQIGSVKAEVNISGLNKVPIMRADCKILDKNGNELTALGKFFSVDIALDIAKEIPVMHVIRGKLAKDFVDNGIRVNPEKVLIAGLPEVIDKINSIETEVISIENINKDTDIVSFLKLPEGVRLVDASKEVKVSVFVEQLVRSDMSFAAQDINIINMESDGSLKYEVTSKNIIIGIKGRQKEFGQLSKSSLKPTIDVARLGEGTHKVPVKISLQGDFKLAEDYTVEVKISKKDTVSADEKPLNTE